MVPFHLSRTSRLQLKQNILLAPMLPRLLGKTKKGSAGIADDAGQGNRDNGVVGIVDQFALKEIWTSFGGRVSGEALSDRRTTSTGQSA